MSQVAMLDVAASSRRETGMGSTMEWSHGAWQPVL
jgi:hypothetical protein